MKYDPDIGIFGMDICVTLGRNGTRVKRRRHARGRIPTSHRITPLELRSSDLTYSHGLNLSGVLQLGWKLYKEEMPKNLVVLAVEADNATSYSSKLTTKVRSTIPKLLKQICKEFEDRTGIVCEVDCRGVEERLSEETELVLYRIIQEALANVAKHSGAGNAKLSLSRVNSSIVATVQDDGRGFDQRAAQNGHGMDRHWGLINMRERAGFLGGTFEVRATPGKGALITARVPITTAGD